MKSVGKAIRAKRLEKGMSQERLAELTEIRKTDISAIENGRRDNLTVKTLAIFAKALDCLPSDLLCLVSDKSTPEESHES